MYSELSDDDKNMYLDVLRDAPMMPFSNFVSRGDIKDKVDIARPRSVIDREVYRLVKQTSQDKSSRLIPILGSAGTGKTHAYHSFKDKEEENRKKLEQTEEIEVGQMEPVNWTIIYVPSPPASIRVLLHVYTCLIEDVGPEILDIVSQNLVEEWKEKLGGNNYAFEQIIDFDTLWANNTLRGKLKDAGAKSKADIPEYLYALMEYGENEKQNFKDGIYDE